MGLNLGLLLCVTSNMHRLGYLSVVIIYAKMFNSAGCSSIIFFIADMGSVCVVGITFVPERDIIACRCWPAHTRTEVKQANHLISKNYV